MLLTNSRPDARNCFVGILQARNGYGILAYPLQNMPVGSTSQTDNISGETDYFPNMGE